MTDWKEKTLAYWQMINSMAVRRFGDGVLAEEAALAVIEGLEADNWQRVRKYNKQSTFATFVRTLTIRLLEDFSRKRFGRVRPPLWVQTFGGFWEKLFTALCLERLPVTESVEIVKQLQPNAGRAELESAAYQLLARIPDCGKHQGLEIALEDDISFEGGTQQDTSDRTVEEQQKKELFSAIFQLVLGAEQFEISETLVKKINLLEISFSSEEQLLLKLCYQDGLGVAKAGEMLGLSRFQAHGKKRRLMARIQGELERTGIAVELRLLLDS